MKNELEQFILANFESAVEKQHIQPYYQPVIRTISRKLCSFEALARWVDPERGVIRPDQFIPVLEQEGLIHLLDQCVIRQVCERLRRTMDRGGMPIPVSVNLSRLDFQLCDIFSAVDELARMYQIPHDFLYIEITESVMGDDEEGMHGIVDRFHAAGYQVWMDDFGSAYSSLNTLKDFTFDELKLDMRFLSSFSQRSRRILTAMVHMAKEIDIHTLTEGVETEEQFHYLRNIGCEKVQGYFFGRPLPYEEGMEHLRATGIQIEPPWERKYYDEIGQVDLLSAAPFLDRKGRDALLSARSLNSIPLGLVEVEEEHFSLLFHNATFEQTARGAGLFPDLFAQELMGKPQPLDMMPEQVRKLLDSTRSRGQGRMFCIAEGDYYELQAKCISKVRERYCVLMQVQNLSKAAEIERTNHLDESVRQLFSLFERITLLDMDADTIEPLYVDTHTDLLSGRKGILALSEEYAHQWVYPEDRDSYLELLDQSTIAERLQKAGHPYVNACMRSAVGHGQYAWKQYTLLHLEAGRYLLLIRNIHEAALQFLCTQAEGAACPMPREGITGDQLWRSLVQSDIIKLFWKDKDRRFLGASQSFLDYYDFPSLDVILGKNDEEVGWHVHADPYRSDEYQVIHEGRIVRNMPGRCIRHGENREILANKAPLYDDNGEIQGLVGYFLDRTALTMHDSRGGDTRRRDMMTGLLNAQGLMEEEQAFQDEYYLRDVDFVRIHIAIDDFSALVAQHGYEFGDKAMIALGNALKQEFGQTSAVARYTGQRYVILRQISSNEEPRQLRERIKAVASTLQNIEGVPLTLYLSVGYAVYSEFENLDEQKTRAENSLMVDHDASISVESRIQHASELFHLYDNLPIPFAVYKVVTGGDGVVTDAVLFYVNRSFEANSGLTQPELLGHSTRELFPDMDEHWYQTATRAALGGESVTDRFFFPPTDSYYYITASQVIHSGYCCFTYLVLDENQFFGRE